MTEPASRCPTSSGSGTNRAPPGAISGWIRAVAPAVEQTRCFSSAPKCVIVEAGGVDAADAEAFGWLNLTPRWRERWRSIPC